jgi:Methyltransferase domain
MGQLLDKLRAPDRSLRKRLSAKMDIRSARNAILASGKLTNVEKSMLSNVSLRLHPKDDMYVAGEGRHYLSVGLSAMRNINKALVHARNDTPITTILDFPSGFARVLRFLKVGFPAATIFGGELEPEAVEFTRTAFGVQTTMSMEDVSGFSLPGPFDLIWSGSLLTHLDERRAIDVLKLFYRHLAQGGLCLFTMHGTTSTEWMTSGVENYGLSPSGRDKVLSELASRGYGYSDYHHGSQYGISVATFSHMLEMASAAGDWALSSFFERAWGRHHDVYGFIRGVTKPPLIIRAEGPAPTKAQYRWPAEF